MIDGTYKLTFDGSKINALGSTVSWSDPNAYHTITLTTDGNGSIQSTTLTGRPGETATLNTNYSAYYRFKDYGLTGGGSIDGNTYTFGTSDATIQANFKPNAFTAIGLWEKGSDITISRGWAEALTQNIPNKYAYLTASTGDIPASWHSTSERWNPSNASAYEATLNPKARYGGTTGSMGNWGGGVMRTNVNGSNIEAVTYKGSVGNYNKTITTTAQGMYYLNGTLTAYGNYAGYNYYGYAYYYASNTTGSWTATGIAP